MSSTIDVILAQFVDLYEERYPQHIVAYYLEGSHGDASAVLTSDIDIVLITRNGRTVDPDLWQSSVSLHTHMWDVTVVEESALALGVEPSLKQAGQLFFGEDIVQNYPLIGIEQWTHQRMHAAYWLLNAVYERPTPVLLTLDYPQNEDEFYGYVNRPVMLADGQSVVSTRNLIRTVGWMATALLAWKSQQYVARKRDCATLYKIWGHDPAGTHLLQQLYTVWRGQWKYLVPSQQEHRHHLRTFCASVLPWERAFLREYRAFLLHEFINGSQEYIQEAMHIQTLWPLADEQVQIALTQATKRRTS